MKWLTSARHPARPRVTRRRWSTRRLPSASWVARSPGARTVVVSICSRMAGPVRVAVGGEVVAAVDGGVVPAAVEPDRAGGGPGLGEGGAAGGGVEEEGEVERGAVAGDRAGEVDEGGADLGELDAEAGEVGGLEAGLEVGEGRAWRSGGGRGGGGSGRRTACRRRRSAVTAVVGDGLGGDQRAAFGLLLGEDGVDLRRCRGRRGGGRGCGRSRGGGRRRRSRARW